LIALEERRAIGELPTAQASDRDFGKASLKTVRIGGITASLPAFWSGDTSDCSLNPYLVWKEAVAKRKANWHIPMRENTG
jgi:hypothetical protein